jgi:hypothetical protein
MLQSFICIICLVWRTRLREGHGPIGRTCMIPLERHGNAISNLSSKNVGKP